MVNPNPNTGEPTSPDIPLHFGSPNSNANNNNPNNLYNNKAINAAQKQIMEEYNRLFSQSTDREKQLTLQYFMGLAAIENEANMYPVVTLFYVISHSYSVFYC